MTGGFREKTMMPYFHNFRFRFFFNALKYFGHIIQFLTFIFFLTIITVVYQVLYWEGRTEITFSDNIFFIDLVKLVFQLV